MLDSSRLGRYATLLALLTVWLLVVPVFRELGFKSGIARIAFATVLLVGVWVASREQSSPRLMIVAAALATTSLLAGAAHGWTGVTWLSVVELTAGVGFVAALGASIIRHLVAVRQVSADLLCGSLVVYLLLGTFFAMLYTALAIVSPHSFSLHPAHVPGVDDHATLLARFVYFSLVTLTTLGYGDIVPTAGLSRMIALLEAVSGQFFLAVLVARMVGLHLLAADDD